MKDELNALKTTRFAKKGVGNGEGCISPTAHIYTLIWLVRVCSPYFNSVGILTACCCNMLYLSFHLYLYSAANGCTKNHQRIGVTVHSHYFESFENLFQRCRRGRGWSELWKKHNLSCQHPIHAITDRQSAYKQADRVNCRGRFASKRPQLLTLQLSINFLLTYIVCVCIPFSWFLGPEFSALYSRDPSFWSYSGSADALEWNSRLDEEGIWIQVGGSKLNWTQS